MKITVNPQLIADGYINKNKHPTKELYIYNYTPKAAYESKWHEFPELKLCRGLILNAQDEVVAYPFPKFFNLEQHSHTSPLGEVPPYKSFEVYDKADGSLGILYHDGDKYAIATRGSFVSDQAIWATNFLHNTYSDKLNDPLLKDKTLLFEIIYAANRIVVEYKGVEGLILLTINNHDGTELDRKEVESIANALEFPLITKFDGINDFKECRSLIKRDNAEGFVVKFDHGLRVKLKYEEYCRLHSIVTKISSKSIWELLKNRQSFDEILNCVPDEFFEWVTATRDNLMQNHKDLMAQAMTLVDRTKEFASRKEQAIFILKENKNLAHIAFALLDGRIIHAEDTAWKMIKPEYEQPFRTGVDEE